MSLRNYTVCFYPLLAYYSAIIKRCIRAHMFWNALYRTFLAASVTPPTIITAKIAQSQLTTMLQTAFNSNQHQRLKIIIQSFAYGNKSAAENMNPQHTRNIALYAAQRGTEDLFGTLFTQPSGRINLYRIQHLNRPELNQTLALSLSAAVSSHKNTLVRLLFQHRYKIHSAKHPAIKEAFKKQNVEVLYLFQQHLKSNAGPAANHYFLKQSIRFCKPHDLPSIYYQIISELGSQKTIKEFNIPIKTAMQLAVSMHKNEMVEFLLDNQNDYHRLSRQDIEAVLLTAIKHQNRQAIRSILSKIEYSLDLFMFAYHRLIKQFEATSNRLDYYLIADVCELDKQKNEVKGPPSLADYWREKQRSRTVRAFMNAEKPVLMNEICLQQTQGKPLPQELYEKIEAFEQHGHSASL